MNRFLLSSVLFLISISVSGAEEELELKLNTNGQPVFGIQYAYDYDFAWAFTYTTTLSNLDLESLPKTVFWNVLQSKQCNLVTSWKEISKSDLQTGTISLRDKTEVSSLLPSLKTAKVVFAVKTQQGTFEILYSIPIGPLCQNYSTNHFVDMTNSSKKGCEVQAKDIPDAQSECNSWATELLDFVQQKLISCATAKAHFATRGCGTLVCQ